MRDGRTEVGDVLSSVTLSREVGLTRDEQQALVSASSSFEQANTSTREETHIDPTPLGEDLVEIGEEPDEVVGGLTQLLNVAVRRSVAQTRAWRLINCTPQASRIKRLLYVSNPPSKGGGREEEKGRRRTEDDTAELFPTSPFEQFEAPRVQGVHPERTHLHQRSVERGTSLQRENGENARSARGLWRDAPS